MAFIQRFRYVICEMHNSKTILDRDLRCASQIANRDVIWRTHGPKYRLSNFYSRCTSRIKIQNTHFAVVWKQSLFLYVHIYIQRSHYIFCCIAVRGSSKTFHTIMWMPGKFTACRANPSIYLRKSVSTFFHNHGWLLLYGLLLPVVKLKTAASDSSLLCTRLFFYLDWKNVLCE